MGVEFITVIITTVIMRWLLIFWIYMPLQSSRNRIIVFDFKTRKANLKIFNFRYQKYKPIYIRPTM